MTATKRLMEADPKFPAFLTELEALLRLWLEERAAQKAKELEEMETSRLKMSPVETFIETLPLVLSSAPYSRVQ